MTAEFDLQVREGGLEKGDWLNAGQKAAVIEDISAVELAMAVPMDDLSWLQRDNPGTPNSRSEWAKLVVGREARVERRLPDGTWRVWQGEVVRVGANLSEQTRMARLYIRVSEPLTSTPTSSPMPLLPGMFCRVSVQGRTLKDVVVLPRKALQSDGQVYLADKGDKLVKRTVTVALIQGDQAILTSGLENGDRVIVTAVPKTPDVSPLMVRKPTESPQKTAAR